MRATDVGRVVPLDGPTLGPPELDAVVEIAYRAMAADGRFDEAEIEAFRCVLSRLRALATPAVGAGAYRSIVTHGAPRAVADADLDALLDRLRASVGDTPAPARRFGFTRQSTLRALAEPLSPAARELAYKVAYAISLADLDVPAEEAELQTELAVALELDPARAAALSHETVAALGEGSEP